MDIIGPNVFWGLIVVVAIIVAVLLRRRRRAEQARRPRVPTPPSAPITDEEYLDSSHIGGTAFDDAVLNAAREKAAREAAAGSGQK